MEKSVMCVGGSSSPSVQTVGPRDTSNEMIVSDYKLSEANKKKNAEVAARNRAKSLVVFNTGSDDGGPIVGGIPFSGKTKSSTNSGYDFTNTA
jgi:hypothetical protein